MLRNDVANVYGREGVGREYVFSELIENLVQKALAAAAACVVEGMPQPFDCATPEEAASTHRLFTAALRSRAQRAAWSR